MIIFDLDGTLWDATQSLADSWGAEIARQMGRDTKFTLDEIRAVLGMTMDEIAAALLPDVSGDERYRIFRKCEQTELEYLTEHGGDLFPKTRETLQRLIDSGRKLAIVSNCQCGYIESFLDSMNMHEFFCDRLCWGDTGLSKGENIRIVMERNNEPHSIYIGDIQKDANACNSVKVPIIWAKYGFGTIVNPAGVAETFADIPAELERLGF